VFVGSEGTLGIIVGARLRAHRSPPAEMRGAYAFPSFAGALDAMRRIVQRGATPAVLRLYDPIEGDRSYQTGSANVLLVLDEGDAHVVESTRRVVDEEAARARAEPLDVALVGRWLGHRNDVSALEALISRGLVVDTMEVSGSWRALPEMYARATEAIRAVEHTLVASAHQSHSYPDGGCLYFTFAGRPPAEAREAYYRAVWDAGQRAVLQAGGALSHHHGVGLNRARFVPEALGAGFGVLQRVKDALDPNGVCNPGKLGLRSPFGDVPWP
jgi:alkyldihydroxyacetonephosphate synthase